MTAITKDKVVLGLGLVGHWIGCLLRGAFIVLRFVAVLALKVGGLLLAIAVGATAAYMGGTFDHR